MSYANHARCTMKHTHSLNSSNSNRKTIQPARIWFVSMQTAIKKPPPPSTDEYSSRIDWPLRVRDLRLVYIWFTAIECARANRYCRAHICIVSYVRIDDYCRPPPPGHSIYIVLAELGLWWVAEVWDLEMGSTVRSLRWGLELGTVLLRNE